MRCSILKCVVVLDQREWSHGVFWYGVLQCVAVCCSMLQSVAVRRSVLQYVAVCCSIYSMCMIPWRVSVRRVAICCSMLQCVAVCCSALHCVAVLVRRVWSRGMYPLRVLQCTTERCSALQCVAVCCSVLQFELHRVAEQCTVLLRTLQHTATHCNVSRWLCLVWLVESHDKTQKSHTQTWLF